MVQQTIAAELLANGLVQVCLCLCTCNGRNLHNLLLVVVVIVSFLSDLASASNHANRIVTDLANDSQCGLVDYKGSVLTTKRLSMSSCGNMLVAT